MRRHLSLVLVATIILMVQPAYAAENKPDISLDMLVVLDGNTVADFLPQNYVQTDSISLDSSLAFAGRETMKSVESFISSNCQGIVEQVYQKYSILTKGFACKIKTRNIKRLASIPGIKSVEKIPDYKLDLDTSTSVIGANDAWKMLDQNRQPLNGTGVIIGVIDTGLDWRHPDLGSRMGSKEKVVDGYDFADGADISNDTEQHGTHVAGICAANGKVKGVAPGANLAGYKVFTSEKGRSVNVGANINAALEKAITSKCGVVNLSLGSPGGSTGGEEGNSIYHKVVKAGIVVVASAGNNGSRCLTQPYVVGTPSTYMPVISVAASDDMKHPEISVTNPPGENMRILGREFDLPPKWPDSEWEVVDCGYGYPSDFEGIDVKGKIALIQRGPITDKNAYFRDKDLNAAKAGAAGCIIYNHSPGSFAGTMKIDDADLEKKFIPALAITNVQGLKLQSLIAKGLKVKVSSGNPFGQIADFSSSGPSADYYFKPEVTAPGVGIRSTVTTKPNSADPKKRDPQWAVMQGTSMSGPHVAGASAILRQAYPKAEPKQIKAIFMATCDLLRNDEAGEYVPLMSQGSGRINIPAALGAKMIFDPPALSLRAISGKVKQASFKVTNISKKQTEFALSYHSLGDTTKCNFDRETEKLKPGETKTITASFVCDDDSKGFLEGVIFANMGQENVHLPLIILNGSPDVPPQVSDLRVSKSIMTHGEGSEAGTTISFRFNYGTFMSGGPGQDVSSNYGAAKIVLYDNEENPTGNIFFDDTLEIGYHNIIWKGPDNLGRLFVKDGDYVVNAFGLSANASGTIVEQSPHQMKPISIVGAPLKEKPLIFIKCVPEKPRPEEPFLLLIKTSFIPSLSSIKLDIDTDPAFYQVSSIKALDVYGNSKENVLFENAVDNEKGKVGIKYLSTNGSSVDFKGTIFAIECISHQEGISSVSIKECTATSSFGQIAPIPLKAVFEIKKGYSFYDLNMDGVVDELDGDILMYRLGTSEGEENYTESMDFDGDGQITVIDFIILAKHYGQTMYP